MVSSRVDLHASASDIPQEAFEGGNEAAVEVGVEAAVEVEAGFGGVSNNGSVSALGQMEMQS